MAKPLFNGNIAAMMVNIPKLSGGTAQLYGYAYDQLNRILSMDAFTGLNNTNNTFTAAASSNYKERITYDANGNIKTYLRNGTTTGGTPLAMDNLTYAYNLSSGKLVNNKLRHVQDAVGDANYTDDIDNQGTDNYDYDAIGNLTRDTKEGISNITWSVYGKILSVTKTSGTITYTYDASGNRVSKTFNGKTTWYVRDPSGNVMAVYEKRSSLNNNHLTQSEVHLYGSSRLGIFNRNLDLENPTNGEFTNFERGRKFFELSNHLGNVLVTVTDRKIQVSAGGSTIDYYSADLVSANDYYPFGMVMQGRYFSAGTGYRYGFNGKEKDKDIGADDYDFGARIYDGRVARWLSVDPLQATYPMLSPYNFTANSPVSCYDPDGRLIIFINGLRFHTGARDQGRKTPTMFSNGKARKGIYHRDKTLQGYWQSDKNSFGRKVDMAERFKIRTGDYNDYYLSGSAEWQSKASDRMADGKAKAEEFHKMVQAGQITLKEGETIKIVSHSHGGAHSSGFAEQLMSYKDKEGKPLYNIEVMYYITPHQPTDITHPTGVRGVQYSHPNDAISSLGEAPFSGGTKLGPIKNITEYVENDVMSAECVRYGQNTNPCEETKPGQVRSTGWRGNRGGHNVDDNDFIFDIPRLEPGGVRYREDNPYKLKDKPKTTGQ